MRYNQHRNGYSNGPFHGKGRDGAKSAPTATLIPAPLYSADAEKAVLASWMSRPEDIASLVLASLEAGDFFVPAHREIFHALEFMHRSEIPLDITTLHIELQNRKVAEAIGSPGYLAELAAGLATHLNCAAYIRIVKDRSLLRMLQNGCVDIVRAIGEHPSQVALVMELVEKRLKSVATKAFESVEIKVRSQIEIRDLNPDPTTNLLGNGFLRRGQTVFLVAQAGIGKSTLCTQQDWTWALGKPSFNIQPNGPLKILTVQAENDDDDMREHAEGMSDGLKRYMNLTLEDEKLIHKNALIVNYVGKSGLPFLFNIVERCLDQHKPDIIRIDPFLSYLADDEKENSVVYEFLNALTVILKKHGAGCIFAHHTTKPPRAKDGTQADPYSAMYDMAGSNGVTNSMRGSISLKTTKVRGLFILHAAKRGNRLGWPPGVFDRHIRYAKAGIFWEDADDHDMAALEEAESEGEPKRGRRPRSSGAGVKSGGLAPIKELIEKHEMTSEGTAILFAMRRQSPICIPDIVTAVRTVDSSISAFNVRRKVLSMVRDTTLQSSNPKLPEDSQMLMMRADNDDLYE